MDFLDRLNRVSDLVLRWCAGFFLVAMVGLTSADIVLRLVWVPIPGSVELMSFFGAMTTALALGYTQRKRMHIAVDILVSGFRSSWRRRLGMLNYSLSMLFFLLCAWELTSWSNTLRNTGELTETLRMVYYPFTYAAALGCASLALVYLTDFLGQLWPKEEARS